MAYNKFVVNNKILLDLTADTVTASTLLNGYKAHDKSGALITGTCLFDSKTTDATATAARILSGYTAYVNKVKVTGTMTNRGTVTGTISTKSGTYTIPQGYHSGSGKVAISATEQAKIIPENIKKGETILGVEGTLSSEPAIWNGSKATSFAGGSGTEADPYLIATAEQLAYLAQRINAGNYSNTYFKLTADIVLNDTSNWENWGTTAPANSWTAIGTSSKSFKGTFDGDGHTVSGVYINTTTNYQGLFGYANNATIKNVGVVESYIKGGSYVGGVVGFNRAYEGAAIVSNCYNTGAVTGAGTDIVYVGGVIGQSIYYSGGTATVSNCYNTGAVTSISSNDAAGGVVGNSNTTVINCYNKGAVTGNARVGGVVGYNGGTVSNCYNAGIVTGSNTSIVGSIVGQNNATLSECYYLNGTASKVLGYGNGLSIGSFVNSISNIEVSNNTTLTYTGTLLSVLNQWVNANKGTYPDVKSWTNKGITSNYPTFKY